MLKYPSAEELRQTGVNLLSELLSPIGQPIPGDAIKIGEDAYQIEGGLESLSKVYFAKNQKVTSYGNAHKSEYEDASFVMFVTFGAALELNLGRPSLKNGIHTWHHGKYSIQLSNPQNTKGIWHTMLMMSPI